MNNVLRRSLLICFWSVPAWTQLSTGGSTVTLTKDVFYASGAHNLANANGDEMGFTLGDPIAGPGMRNDSYELFPGYYGGGRLGTGTTINVKRIQVAPASTALFQDQLQVGVPVSAPVNIDFSDTIDTDTVASGVQVFKLQDHLGTLLSQNVPIQTTVDPLQQSVVLTPTGAWEGNTLYAVVVGSAIRSISGYRLEPEARTLYLTVLDPKQENLLLQAVNGAGSLSATAVVSGGGVTLNLPVDTLSDYAAILSSKDPLNAPLRVDPKIVDEANRKAQAASPYRVPLVVREMNALDLQGRVVTRLSKPAQLTLGTNDGSGTGAISRAQLRSPMLSLWTLDEDHHVWLKVPGGKMLPDGTGVTAPVTQLAVFALMGEAVESASDAYAFPVPWRPHGSLAGSGPSQTGTEAGGITFGSLPSECKIRIYTLSGELVRELHHSNITGELARETWDVKTVQGHTVASGVYFWRVESDTDSKNGKLMVIR